MTKQELNRDIKRLAKSCKFESVTSSENYNNFCTEFKRLYNADTKFEYMNKKSVLTMFRLNLRYNFISLHSFGLFITI